ncbi:MAG: hypothetical protein HY725_08695 [Candidatus Rokubacteria bacterium]|nr:hypothetical protein [Candidatus Rokubacteria bacterium]
MALFAALSSTALAELLPRLQGPQVEVAHGGNRLSVLTTAAVHYRSPWEVVQALGERPPSRRYALLLSRDSPREVTAFLLGVTEEGTLLLGAQRFAYDAASRQYVDSGGDLYRAYPPLEGKSPWTWLVTIPVSREYEASLEIRAVNAPGPVRTVRIFLMSRP